MVVFRLEVFQNISFGGAGLFSGVDGCSLGVVMVFSVGIGLFPRLFSRVFQKVLIGVFFQGS